MLKNKIIAVSLALTMALLLTGCKIPFLKDKSDLEPDITEVVDPNYPVVVRDTEIPSKPANVVSLSASITEKIYDLGMQESLVGVPDYTNYPSDAVDIQICGSALSPDIELIEDLGADIVFTSTAFYEDILEAFDELGIVVVHIPSAVNLSEVWESYTDIARALEGEVDGTEKAEDFTSDVKAWFEEVKSRAGLEESINILYLRQLDFVVATGDTLEGEIFKELGLNNIASQQSDWIYPEEQASSEEGKEAFRSTDLLIFDDDSVTIKKLEEHAYYKGLPAVLEDKYVIVNPEAIERQSLSMFSEIAKIVDACWEDISIPEIGDTYEREDTDNQDDDSESTGPEDEFTDPDYSED